MTFQTWEPVPLQTPFSQIAPGAVLIYTDEEAVVVDARRAEKGKKKLELRIQRPNGEQLEREVQGGETIAEQGSALLEGVDCRAVLLPTVIWHEDKLFSARNVFAMAVSAVTTTLFVWLTSSGSNPVSFLYLSFLIAGASAMYARKLWKGARVSFLAPERLGLTMDTVLAYALTREAGKLWVPPTPGADRRGLIRERVAAIRAAYLELREDIVYRIESPALFDPAVPVTAQFEAALVAFDDATDLASTDQLDALASEVEVSFNVAQANAERLGLAHLPEDARADAKRAGKAARLAVGAATEGERQASLNQVKRILDSLALYYLPTIDEKLALEP